MSHFAITIGADASGTLEHEGSAQPIAGADIAGTREAALDAVRAHARSEGAAATAEITEPDGSARLTVLPDGRVLADEDPGGESSAPEGESPEAPEGEDAWAGDQGPAPWAADSPATSSSSADWEQVGGSAAPLRPIDGLSASPDGPGVEDATTSEIDAWTVPDASSAAPAPRPFPGSAADAAPAAGPTPSPDGTSPAEDAAADPGGEVTWEEIAARPATLGWRGALNRVGLNLPPGDGELAVRRFDHSAARRAEDTARRSRRREETVVQVSQDREQRSLIQTNFQGPRTLLVANPKGGSRKTTTSYLLAATLGTIRGGSVVAWDANESTGSLGERSLQDLHTRTVVDLVDRAESDFGSVSSSRLGVLDRYVRGQGDAHFDVLAADEDPTGDDVADGAAFDTVHEILERFYRLIVLDSGNNMRLAHFRAALEHTDLLVVPVTTSLDSASAARRMFDALDAGGKEDLVAQAVVLLQELEDPSVAGEEDRELARTLGAEFAERVAGVIVVPFDPALKRGGAIDPGTLRPSTLAAYRDAAALIAGLLREQVYGQPPEAD